MSILDLLFPITCLACKSFGKYLCKDCLLKVKKSKQICIECDKPSIDGFTHIKCKKPQTLDGVFSVWQYSGVIRRAILKLKYNFVSNIAIELAEIMAKYVSEEFNPLPKKPLLIPVPLHKKRKNWRGFNQVEEVGKVLAKKLGWDFNCDILVRKKKSTPQVELKGEERKENVRGVFAFEKNKKSLILSSSSLVLFDDVLTTGATIREAGKVMKRNGAEKVWGLTIAS